MSCKPAQLRAHPCAEILPLLEGEPFDKLVADIRANGLLQPITIHQGMILDGRNRFRACEAAGIEPRFVEYGGDDPLSFVLSLNVHRRHLDESQRAMVAARLANMRQGARTDLQPSANLPEVSQAQAAKKLNVSERSVRSAVAVRDHATPELIQAVEQGKIPVSTAARVATPSRAIQHQAVVDPERAHVLVKQQLALPNKRFGVIYADQSWRFSVDLRDAIMKLDVASIAADDCVLFLGAIASMLPQALEVIAAWGFAYRTNYVLAKNSLGTSYSWFSHHEHLLVGVKGDIPEPARRRQPGIMFGGNKSDPFAEMIERLFPTLPKIELFARGKARPGWAVYGNEAEVEAEA
jgi:N6-adenosine-specific RNA methylase IME4